MVTAEAFIRTARERSPRYILGLGTVAPKSAGREARELHYWAPH